MYIHKNKKGFTLIELLVVISIVGMMSSVVLAAVNNARKSGEVAAGLSFSGYNYRTIGDQAFVLYDFDEPSGNASDKSGNNYNLSLTAATRDPDKPSKSGSSLSITGATAASASFSASKNICNNINTTSGCPAYSISAWINPADISAHRFIVETLTGGIRTHQMSIFDGTAPHENINCGVSGTPPSTSYVSVVFSEYTVKANEWQHIVCSVDITGSKVTLFVNGKAIATKTLSGVTVANISQLVSKVSVGNDTSGSVGYQFSGKIDDVAIYSRAVTASEVGEIYAQTAPKYNVALK